MHTLALPKSVLCSELGPQWRMAHYELAYLIKKKAKFKVEGAGRLYTTKPGAEPMDVTCAPVTACRACKNAGRGVTHHWFHECPAFD